MKTLRTGLTLVVLLALVAAVVAACGATPTATPTVEKIGGTVTIYTSMRRQIIDAVKKDFEAKYPGTTVNIFRSGTGEVMAKFQAEEQANAIVPDVISVADMDFFRTLAKKNMLVKYVPPETAAIANAFKYEEGLYYEVRFSGMCLIYNTDKVKEKPTSWKDLIDPKFKDKVAIPGPAYSGGAFTAVGTLVASKDFGQAFVEALKANGGKVLKGNPEVARDVATGEYYLGMTNDSEVLSLKSKGSPVDLVYPKEGAIVLSQPIAILKTSKNLPTAKALVNYMFTVEAMKMMATYGYNPVRPGTAQPGTPAIESIKVFPTDWEYLGTNRQKILDDFAKVFGGL